MSAQDAATSSEGASPNQRLLAAAREDNEDMLLEVFQHEGEFDINYQDGLGNTALHYAASNGSVDVLEHILSHPDCDVDPVNRVGKSTPLHLALTEITADLELRQQVVESLIEAGADTMLKDRNGDTALDLVGDQELTIKAMIRKARAEANMAHDDIVNDDEDDDGSGSDSDEE